MSKSKQRPADAEAPGSPAPPAVMRLVHTHHTGESTKDFAVNKKKPAAAGWLHSPATAGYA
jgi:hypothetical protein